MERVIDIALNKTQHAYLLLFSAETLMLCVCVRLTLVPYSFLLRNKAHTHTYTWCSCWPHGHLSLPLAATVCFPMIPRGGRLGSGSVLWFISIICSSSHTPWSFHLYRIPFLHISVYFKHCASHFIWHVSRLYWLACVLSADVCLAPPAGLSLSKVLFMDFNGRFQFKHFLIFFFFFFTRDWLSRGELIKCLLVSSGHGTEECIQTTFQ